MEEYVVEVVNLTQGKLYYLSKPYFDRVTACVYGQDYVRDHRQENKDLIYFRVVVKSTVKSFTPVNFNIDWHDGEECSCSPIEETPCPEDQNDCFQCPKFSQCWEEVEEEEAEEEEEEGEPQSLADPYQNCLLVQRMIEDINKSFNSSSNSTI